MERTDNSTGRMRTKEMFNVPSKLASLEAPIDVGIIGGGVFGTKLVDQLERVNGMHTAVVADIDLVAGRDTFREAGVDGSTVSTVDTPEEVNEVIASGGRALLEDGMTLVHSDVDVVVEATGVSNAAAKHAFSAIMAEKHVVMVTVEVDTVVGPILAEMADSVGVTYSMAYGDQPSLLIELCDWAETIGLDVVAVGKGNPYLPEYRFGTPEDVFERWGFDEGFVEEQNLNPYMYNSFLDGTKVAVEMCAVANATGLTPDVPGMHLPDAAIPEIPEKLRPTEDGGILESSGVVDTISSRRPDGTEIDHNIEFGVFVVTTTSNERVQQYLDQLSGSGLYTASAGQYQLFYRPYHLPGVETPVSIANAALRNEATGAPRSHETEVVGGAKRTLTPGDQLDGGGGFTTYGYLVDANRAAEAGYVPFELLDGAEVISPVDKGDLITFDDVSLDEDSFLYTLRSIQDAR